VHWYSNCIKYLLQQPLASFGTQVPPNHVEYTQRLQLVIHVRVLSKADLSCGRGLANSKAAG
jgi:hypothetical protein